MSLHYRAIWRDCRQNLIETARPTFQEWIDGKKLELQVPHEGAEHAESSEVFVQEASDGDIRGLRIRLSEEKRVKEGLERWSTTTYWMLDGSDGWVWVDNEWVLEGAFERARDPIAPNLVGKLLSQREPGQDLARLGPRPTTVKSDDVDDLVSWLFSEQREVPLVLFSTDSAISPQQYSARVRETARRLAGCADVRLLLSESGSHFHHVMNPLALSVFDGAVRIYLPGVSEDDPQPWRHRYIRARYLTEKASSAARLVVRQILPRMTSQRPPEIYRNHIKSLLDLSQRDWQSFAIELDGQVSERDTRIAQLTDDLELLQLEREEALDGVTAKERELAKVKRWLERLQQELRRHKVVPELIVEESESVPAPESCQEAIELARDLPYVVIHPKAPQMISRLDESPNSERWAQKIYDHLKALDAYAEDQGVGFDGGFKQWCDNSENLYKISSRYFASTESESVRSREKYRSRRILPIDVQVDPSGRIEMFGHLKPVPGGGPQIPRIYFHDDTNGATKKVHIGFIGPHELMPNLSTN